MRSVIDTTLLDALQRPGGATPGYGEGLPGVMPPTPFVWGQGGAQLTPEQLASQRMIAESLAQSDYSPVQSWTQGLGRVLDNFDGARRLKRLDGQEQQMAADRLAQITQMAGSSNADLAAGLASNDPVVQALASQQLTARTPKQVAPTEWERTLQASGIMPGTPEWQKAMATKVQNTLDPWTTIVSGGESLSGRQSLVDAALNGRGGGPASSGIGAGVPTGSPLTAPPARPQGVSDAQLISEARDAISKGADPTAVFKQLQGWGVNP